MNMNLEPHIKPDVWTMPDKGLSWCDCGKDHPLTLDIVAGFAEELGIKAQDSISHHELVELTMEVWNYESVCRFFHLVLNESAERVHGSVADSYPLGIGLDIVGYFSKTWQGCPDEDCWGED